MTSSETSKKVNVLYTAEATAEGGRKGHAKSSDGRLEVQFSSPTEMGGDDGPGTNPEQLFAAGYAACFQNAMLGIARREHLSAEDSIVTARVGIGQIGNGRLGLEVDPRITSAECRRARPSPARSRALRLLPGPHRRFGQLRPRALHKDPR